MDIADHAAETEALHRAAAMRNMDRGPVIHATGACLCCDSALPPERRWCDADCRDVWQKRNR